MNKNGIHKYNFIQRNTIMYWILIVGSLYLSKTYFNNYWYSIIIFILLFIIHEILWYKFFITFFIDEGEITENWYNNANIYLDTIDNGHSEYLKKLIKKGYGIGYYKDVGWSVFEIISVPFLGLMIWGGIMVVLGKL